MPELTLWALDELTDHEHSSKSLPVLALTDDARPTVVQQSLCGYLDGAMSADDLGPSLLTWASCINKAGSVEALRLLETDPKAGYVINQCSQYYGLRNAKTVQEWISLFFYIVLTELANVSPRVLPRKDPYQQMPWCFAGDSSRD